MNLSAPLTKENFWDAIERQYPKSMKEFKEWIDEYKATTGWKELFNYGFRQADVRHVIDTPKYHELPYDIQQGIWIHFAQDVLNKYFEQPEYNYELDLEEDIRRVFYEVEPLID